MDSTQLQPLLQGAAYLHSTNSIQLIETHISWIVLTGVYAYKIKKPVNFGFLDFSDIDQRRFYCEEECRLNRRYAEAIYLGVCPICQVDNQPDSINCRGDGDVIDYAVKMVQFDPNQCLEVLSQRGELTLPMVAELGRRIAQFHNTLPRRDRELDVGHAAQVLAPMRQNFEQLRNTALGQSCQAQLDVLADWTQATFDQRHAQLRQRHEQGFIKECHGDLHLGNIVVIDGQCTLFDGIEFNTQLRCIDTMSELAFLLMDLRRVALMNPTMAPLASRLLNEYMTYTGDYQGSALLPFYQVYRALVRAKVLALQAQQQSTAHPHENPLTEPFNHYITLAQHISQPSEPALIMMHGLSGSGKSTLAAQLSLADNRLHLRSDVERKRLFSLAPMDSSTDHDKAGLYGPSANQQTFSSLLSAAEHVLRAGITAIVDATFLRSEDRIPFENLATSTGVALLIISCNPPHERIVAHLNQREQNRGRGPQSDASEATVEIMEQQRKFQNPLTDKELAVTLSINEAIDQQCVARCNDAIKALTRKPH